MDKWWRCKQEGGGADLSTLGLGDLCEAYFLLICESRKESNVRLT